MGEGACDFAIALAKESDFLIYLQVPQAKDLGPAREKVEQAGYYGTRIFLDAGGPEPSSGR